MKDFEPYYDEANRRIADSDGMMPMSVTMGNAYDDDMGHPKSRFLSRACCYVAVVVVVLMGVLGFAMHTAPGVEEYASSGGETLPPAPINIPSPDAEILDTAAPTPEPTPPETIPPTQSPVVDPSNSAPENVQPNDADTISGAEDESPISSAPENDQLNDADTISGTEDKSPISSAPENDQANVTDTISGIEDESPISSEPENDQANVTDTISGTEPESPISSAPENDQANVTDAISATEDESPISSAPENDQANVTDTISGTEDESPISSEQGNGTISDTETENPSIPSNDTNSDTETEASMIDSAIVPDQPISTTIANETDSSPIISPLAEGQPNVTIAANENETQPLNSALSNDQPDGNVTIAANENETQPLNSVLSNDQPDGNITANDTEAPVTINWALVLGQSNGTGETEAPLSQQTNDTSFTNGMENPEINSTMSNDFPNTTSSTAENETIGETPLDTQPDNRLPATNNEDFPIESEPGNEMPNQEEEEKKSCVDDGLDMPYFADIVHRMRTATSDELCRNAGCSCLNPNKAKIKSEEWMENVMTTNVERMKNDFLSKGLQPDVVIYGDSITEHLNGRNNGILDDRFAPMAEVTKQLLSKEGGGLIDGLPMGMAADQMAHLLWRLENGEKPPELQPKVWWINIGINDIGMGGCTADALIAGFVKILWKILNSRKNDAPVVLNSILPAGPGDLSQNSVYQEVLVPVNRRIECYAELLHEDKNVYYVDAESTMTEKTEAGTFLRPGYYMEDNLHPSVEGAMQWEELIVRNVMNLTGQAI